jgi:hypothetical protein
MACFGLLERLPSVEQICAFSAFVDVGWGHVLDVGAVLLGEVTWGTS